MKTIVTITLLFCSVFGYASTDSIKIDSLQRVSANTIASSERALNQSSRTIENLNSLTTGFGVIYAIITLVIALLAVALPIFVNSYVIKPARKELKLIESKIDCRVQEKLNTIKSDQFKLAIELFKTGDPDNKNKAITIIDGIRYSTGFFSDEQYFIIYSLIKEGLMSKHEKAMFQMFLFTSINQYADHFLMEVEGDDMQMDAIIKYQIRTTLGIAEKSISRLMGSVANQYLRIIYFNHVLHIANLVSTERFFEILNSVTIASAFNDGDLFDVNLNQYSSDPFTRAEIYKTVIGKKKAAEASS